MVISPSEAASPSFTRTVGGNRRLSITTPICTRPTTTVPSSPPCCQGSTRAVEFECAALRFERLSAAIRQGERSEERRVGKESRARRQRSERKGERDKAVI